MHRSIRFLALCICALIMGGVAWGQGVFTSAATGNWNASGSWTLSSGSDADGIPDADDDVTITTHSITVPVSTTVECNNLTVNNTTQRVLMAGASSILNVYGTLNAAATPTVETIIDCSADASAKLVFKRTTNGALFGATWAAIGTGFRFEVDLPVGITGTASTSVKAREITITSGTFDLGTSELRPDQGTNLGILTIQSGASLSCNRVSRTGTGNTPFQSFTINGTGKATFKTSSAFPSATTTLTFSSTSTIEYAGGAYAIVDRNYEGSSLAFSGTGIKTWTLAASPRTVAGNITVAGGGAGISMGGGQVTVSGNVTVDEGGTIGCSNNSGLFVAAASGTQTFTLNGSCRVVSNSSQAPNPTTGFIRQFAFDAYSFGANSIVSFRNPTTTASTTIPVNIDQPAATPFANVEFYDIQTVSTTTCEFVLRQDIEVTGSIAFPRIASGQPVVFNMNGKTLKVGKQILNSLGALGSNTGNTNSSGGTRTYTMDGTLELNGSSAQNTLGGADLPTTLNNLTVNNSNGITLNGSITVDATLAFTLGNLRLGAVDLTLGSSATVTGAAATKCIVTDGAGAVYRAIAASGSFQFPIGPSATEYNPLTVALVTGSETFNVRVQNGFSNAPPNSALCVQKTWHINKGAGAVDANLTFQWKTSEEGGSFIRNTSSAFRWDAGDSRYYEGAGSGGFPTEISTDTWSGTYAGAATFSPYIVGAAGGLPIQLSSFTGSYSNNAVRLTWTTISEINNYGFFVEKRRAESGEQWTEIPNSFIRGNGTTNQPHHYSYVDHAPQGGSLQYRLRQVDLDGSVHFTEPISISSPTSIKETAPVEFSLKQNYPNPFNPETNIKFSVDQTGRATLELYNMLGQKVATLFDDVVESGVYQTVRFSAVGGSASGGNASGLASGTYIYRLQSGKNSDLKKLVLIK